MTTSTPQQLKATDPGFYANPAHRTHERLYVALSVSGSSPYCFRPEASTSPAVAALRRETWRRVSTCDYADKVEDVWIERATAAARLLLLEGAPSLETLETVLRHARHLGNSADRCLEAWGGDVQKLTDAQRWWCLALGLEEALYEHEVGRLFAVEAAALGYPPPAHLQELPA